MKNLHLTHLWTKASIYQQLTISSTGRLAFLIIGVVLLWELVAISWSSWFSSILVGGSFSLEAFLWTILVLFPLPFTLVTLSVVFIFFLLIFRSRGTEESMYSESESIQSSSLEHNTLFPAWTWNFLFFMVQLHL